MKKFFAILIGTVVLSGCGSFGSDTDTIKIGVILPLTGEVGNLAESVQRGLEIADDQLNQPVELVYQDDQADPLQAVRAYHFLRDIHHVSTIIGSGTSASTLALAPLVEQDQVVLITPSAGAETISEAGDFIFRNNDFTAPRCAKLAQYAADNFQKVAIIFVNDNEAFLLIRDYFNQFFTELGGQITTTVEVTGDSTSFRTELTKFKPALLEAEAILVASFTEDGAILLRQMRELGIDRPILANKTYEDPDFVAAVGEELAEGVTYPISEYTRDSDPQFWDTYVERFDKNPSVYAPQGYDTLMILADILTRCDSTDTLCIRDELYAVEDYPGAAGSVTFDEHGDAVKKIVVKQIQDGQFVKIFE